MSLAYEKRLFYFSPHRLYLFILHCQGLNQSPLQSKHSNGKLCLQPQHRFLSLKCCLSASFSKSILFDASSFIALVLYTLLFFSLLPSRKYIGTSLRIHLSINFSLSTSFMSKEKWLINKRLSVLSSAWSFCPSAFSNHYFWINIAFILSYDHNLKLQQEI